MTEPGADYRGADRRSLLGGAAVAYQGPDRRRSAYARLRVRNVRQLAWPLLLALFIYAVLRIDVTGGAGAVTAYRTLRAAGASLLLLAGAALLIDWALTGRAVRALDGAGLLLIGAGLLTLIGPYGELLHDHSTNQLISADARLAIALPAVALLARAPGTVPIDSGIRPMRVLSLTAAASLTLLGAAGVARWLGPSDVRGEGEAELGALALMWLIAAARRITSARGEEGRDDRHLALGAAFLLFGIGEVGAAVALRHQMRWAVPSAGVQVLAAVCLLWASASWLLESLRRDGNRQWRLAGELQARTEALAGEQALRERLLHDGRNMLAAIRTANITLDRYADRLDQSTQNKLRDTVGAEVDRLVRLLDPSHDRDLEVFDLGAAVMPIVNASAAAGVPVRCRLAPGGCVTGRIADTAAVVHALLANAAQHAPGAGVEVWSETSTNDVRLIVADHGPGIPAGDLEAVFRRGYRKQGDAEPGGLGLYIARRLMADQEGALTLESRDGWGGYAVMTLPAAGHQPPR